ncbi:hypothetical protein FQV39_30700 (plasmid) [Bosea sp. F3-2]|uniref:hypothetical protein n=1 Tax=Bosea sp. F3-2 TaxID=2599640 RepID=UPI0011EED98A|nr:hypothetical protein [Bosea sp. F3-2]QEL27014.1 hypothetical protein FQV39_30700 [Bosea sp. F3-2]
MDSRTALTLQGDELAGLLSTVSDGRVHHPADIAGSSEDRSLETSPESYPAWRAASLAAFSELKAQGLLPREARLQTSVPVTMGNSGSPGQSGEAEAETSVNSALPAHIARIAAALPAAECAIQLELPYAALSEATRASTDADAATGRAAFVAEALRVIEAVPGDVELSLHFDCRDGARFTMTPSDAEVMAELAREILARASRPVDLIHIPVPLRHESDAFFSGLASLEPPPATRLCLGLIHLSDGLEGARRRIDLARRHLATFAIAARSGFAARPPDAIRPFLRLHAEVAREMAALS